MDKISKLKKLSSVVMNLIITFLPLLTKCLFSKNIYLYLTPFDFDHGIVQTKLAFGKS